MHVLPFLFLLLQLSSADKHDSELPGHMKPLGSHMDPLPVHRISYLPSPREFHKKYVMPKLPLIVEGALNNASVWRNWQDDDYLREHFGNEEVAVEQGKKENRSDPSYVISFKEFLDRYKEEDIYLVQELPPPMYQVWELPRPLLCGGFLDNLSAAVIWFSSGGTNSVLHSDSNENLHCLLSGKKRFVMIEPHHSKVIGPEHQEKGFYNLDVDKVDMTKYPELSRIPWYLAELQKGDCLYIPYLWLHNVYSTGRNMGVNVWWKQFEFNDSDCPPDREEPEFLPLGQVELVPEIIEALQRVARQDNSVYAEDLHKLIHEKFGVNLESVVKLLDVLEPGCNGVILNYAQVPRQRLKEGDAFISNLLQESQAEEHAMMSEEEMGEVEEFGGTKFVGEDDYMNDVEEGGGDYSHDEL